MSEKSTPPIILYGFKLLALLPLSLLHFFGYILGLILYIISFFLPQKTQKIFNVIKQAGFAKPQQILRKYLMIIGAAVFDYSKWWLCEDRQLKKYINFTDKDDVLNKYNKQGVIFVGGHFSSTEAIGRLVGFYRSPLHFIYQGSNRKSVEYIHNLRGYFPRFLPVSTKNTSTLKTVLKELKNQGSIVIYADMPPPADKSIEVTFFGKACKSMVLPHRLQTASGAAVVYFECIQRFGGYDITLYDISAQINDSAQESMQVITNYIENSAKKNPQQYLWFTNKYKEESLKATSNNSIL